VTWIYAVPSWVLAPVAIAAFCAIAAIGLSLARRHLVRNETITHNDVAGPILATIGTVLAVMLSFMVVSVWQQYETSANTVEREASAASDIHHLADLLTAPTRNRLKAEVDRYILLVINDEFPAMRHGRSSTDASYAAYRIYGIVAAFSPASSAQTQLQAQALELAHTLTDARRSRLHDNATGIPPILWAAMLFMGALTVGFCYFFRIDSARAHLWMVVAMTSVIAVTFVLIAELDYPYRGDTGIGPQAFVAAYARIHNLER
jgi:hypothetical protein